MSYLVEYRIRIRNYANNADLLVVTSVASDTAPNYPYLKEPPKGDGASFDPLTNTPMAASYTAYIVDAIKSGTDRVVTSLLEDGSQKLQLGYLKAFVESRIDGGAYTVLCAGYLVLFRLVDAITWEFTIQDASRVQGGVELFTTQSTTAITTFLSTWPNRGCVFGGPIKGSFLTMPDWGGWEMRVNAYTVGGRTRYWLEPLTTYGPNIAGGRVEWSTAGFNSNAAVAAWKPGPDMSAFAGGINQIGQGLSSGIREVNYGLLPFSTIADTYARGVQFPGFVLLIDGVPFRPVDPYHAQATNPRDYIGFNDLVSDGKNHGPNAGVYALLDGQTALTNGAHVRVRGLTILPSDVSPIYLDRHPVDLRTDMWTIAGISYDSTAATALKNALGAGLRIATRVTGTKQMGQFCHDLVDAWAQIATRPDSSGRLVPFSTAIFANTPPTKTITDALVVDGATRLPFELDVTQALQRVTLRQKQYLMLVNSPDGVGEIDVELTLLNGDASALPSGTLEISVPGMIRSDPAHATPVDLNWLAGLAGPLFDRFGRGNQVIETDFMRGDGTTDADTALLGDEILVNIKQLPNHNKRLSDDGTVGARAMQITRITEFPARRAVRLADSGPNAQPIATVPTHTIAASADLPRSCAELTITNAATLNASGYGVRVQVAVTTGATPATTDYVDAYTSTQGAVPTGVIRLPAVIAGRKVYARARSEKTGSRPSNWSTGVGVTLSAINDPTTVVAATVAGDGSFEDLTWAIGANASACLTDIWLRASGAAFSTAVLVWTLPAGSVSYRLAGLTPNTAYIASVQHRDLDTQDVSNPVDVSFSALNTTYTLNPPINPHGFSYANTPAYGIVVSGREFPSDVEVAEAVETSVGSGSYGAFTTVGRVASVVGDWTKWTGFAARDRLRRQLKARHIRDGTTVSAYTAIVTVTPWTTQAIPTYPIAAPYARIVKTAAGTNRAFEVVSLEGALGTNDAGPLQWRYKLGTASYPSYSTAALPQSLSITRAAAYDTPLVFEILQGDGQQAIAAYNIPARIEDGSPIPREDWHRGGFGGIATPRGIINPHTQYSGDGTTVLIDPVIGTVTVDLKAADGVKGIESTRGANTKGAHYAGHGAQGITGEGRTRVGKGGVEVPGASFETEPIYDSTGALALLDPVAKTATANLTGPTGIGMTVIERGGNKGDNALDSGFVAVTTAVDFTRGYTSKHLGNMPDDSGSDRRAATANQKTGGDRGFSTIDSGNVVVAAGADFSRSYTNKHLDNVSDGTTYKRVTGVVSSQVTPSSSQSRNRCRVRNSAVQSINSSSDTIATFDTEDYDSNGLHDTGSLTGRLTVPTGGGTKSYLIWAAVSWASNGTGYRQSYIRKNGTTVVARSAVPAVNSGASPTEYALMCIEDAPADGDYWELIVNQNSGAALNLTTDTRFGILHQW